MGELYNNLTIVIPAHNRPNHLKRLLEYYMSYGIAVIVSDSSRVRPQYIDDFHSEIDYYFYPDAPLTLKLFKILPVIKTPYVIMCADDDFIAPETIIEIIAFLEKNSLYNSGQGNYLSFTPSESDISLAIRYPNIMDIDLNEDKPSDRLISLMNNYFQYYYVVFRTETFNEIINSTIKDGAPLVKNLCLLELYISSYSAILGKHIIIPQFYSAREYIIDSAASFIDNIPEVMRNIKYKEEFNNYIDLLTQVLISKENLSKKEATNVILKSLELYESRHFKNACLILKIFKKCIKKILIWLNLWDFLIKKNKNEVTRLAGFEYWKNMEAYIRKHNYLYKK